MFFSLIVYSGS